MRILLSSLLVFSALSAGANSDVHLLGELRRMFTARDIGPNVDLAQVSKDPHLYALGPLAGLKGEITVADGQVFVSKAKDLTHEAHDAAKVFLELTNAPVELVGFFTNREGDGGSFVHMGQTTHIHIITKDRKQMGHLESIKLGTGARLLLPANG